MADGYIFQVLYRPVPTISNHVQPSGEARCLIFSRILRPLSYFMYANSEGSGETALVHRLAWAFAGRLCDKYHNFMSWLIFVPFPLIGFVEITYSPWEPLPDKPYCCLMKYVVPVSEDMQ